MIHESLGLRIVIIQCVGSTNHGRIQFLVPLKLTHMKVDISMGKSLSGGREGLAINDAIHFHVIPCA